MLVVKISDNLYKYFLEKSSWWTYKEYLRQLRATGLIQ